jgi:hypothetical protein
MSLPSKEEMNRGIIAGNIDRHPEGRRLTPEARERAIDFGTKVWKGDMGNGRAAEIGIEHVKSEVFER